jgi:hypothetical protein
VISLDFGMEKNSVGNKKKILRIFNKIIIKKKKKEKKKKFFSNRDLIQNMKKKKI